MKLHYAVIPLALSLVWFSVASAQTSDRDFDGLTDGVEVQTYGTNPDNPDTDGDTTADGKEVTDGSNPLQGEVRQSATGFFAAAMPAGAKRIEVDLSEQRLELFAGDEVVMAIPISSGLAKTPTPQGLFKVQIKKPVVHYRGPGYNLPNTKWNLQFLPGYYIHGAYWHNNFGHPMSHGCVNVSYANMEKLYALVETGTPILIRQ